MPRKLWQNEMIRIFKHYIARWSLLLLAMETLIFIASIYGGVAIRFLDQAHPDEMHSGGLFPRALFFAVVMILSMTAMGRYQHLMENGQAGEILGILLSFVVGIVAMSLLFYVFPHLFIGRGAFGYTLLLALMGVMLNRALFVKFVLDMDLLRRRILVVGAGEQARFLENALQQQSVKEHRIIGFLPIPGELEWVSAEKVLRGSTLNEVVKTQGVHLVVLTDVDILPRELMEQMLDCKMRGVRTVDLLGFFEQADRVIRMDLLDPQWWIFHSDGLERNLLQELSKKFFDVVVSLFLIGITWPLMLLAVLAIWVDSGFRGPVFYTQQRVGYGGRVFKVVKFRSMHTDAEGAGPQWAQRNDRRITRVGHVLRQTRIDELPQFFNVLKGEMSLVGPRPERPEFVEILAGRIPYYRERLRVKPGITGWAQICYGYGASVEDAVEKLYYDLYYVKNQGLFFDLLVLIHSVEVVLFGRGATGPRRLE
ncbi:MAG: TIGR03013 family PEP-CTERM/XrtA system glycosyltransferase [Magnetococcales bacterium]|nr:TIGR03013 family PEP-CTERM/XrtA system glycosyltransferase [Magnetococcales bacterium]MBF0309556.1 TIGR03013 family PEP-CTERM/XrtA system glycosyltransferase [Magnetococcales bacterium]